VYTVAILTFGVMSSKEIGLREARVKLGDLVTAAQYGHTTIITRNGKPVAQITPYTPQEAPMAITVAALADELGVTQDDIRALADQLVEIDGSEAVVAHEDRYSVTLTASAAETIREQIRGENASEGEIDLTEIRVREKRTSEGRLVIVRDLAKLLGPELDAEPVKEIREDVEWSLGAASIVLADHDRPDLLSAGHVYAARNGRISIANPPAGDLGKRAREIAEELYVQLIES